MADEAMVATKGACAECGNGIGALVHATRGNGVLASGAHRFQPVLARCTNCGETIFQAKPLGLDGSRQWMWFHLNNSVFCTPEVGASVAEPEGGWSIEVWCDSCSSTMAFTRDKADALFTFLHYHAEHKGLVFYAAGER